MGKGWHYLLGAQRLYPLLAGERIPPIPSPAWLLPPGTRGVTPNHQALAWAGAYLYSHRYGSLAEQSEAYYLALTFYSQQLTGGFMLGELLCPDPHAAYWLTPAVAFFLGSTEFGHEDVQAASVGWFLSWLALMGEVTTPDGEYFSPGTRCKGLPKSQVATALYRELLGLDQHGPHNQPCVSAVRAQSLGGQSRSETTERLRGSLPLPHTRWPLTTKHTDRGYVATIDFGPRVDHENVDRVAVLYGPRPKTHRMEFGRTGEEAKGFDKLREEILK